MPPAKANRPWRPRYVEVIETSLIIGLAVLVVVKGGGAVGGVFLGLGQMMAALVSVATH